MGIQWSTDIIKRSARGLGKCHVANFQFGSVNHLPKQSGNFGWNVNGKTILVRPTGKFPK